MSALAEREPVFEFDPVLEREWVISVVKGLLVSRADATEMRIVDTSERLHVATVLDGSLTWMPNQELGVLEDVEATIVVDSTLARQMATVEVRTVDGDFLTQYDLSAVVASAGLSPDTAEADARVAAILSQMQFSKSSAKAVMAEFFSDPRRADRQWSVSLVKFSDN